MLKSSKNKLILALLVVSMGILSFANKSGEKGKNFSLQNSKVNKIKSDFLSREEFLTKKLLIINFWASWCVPCLTEIPSLNRLYELKKEQGLYIVGINSDYENQKKLIQKTKKKYNITFPLIADKRGELLDAFSVSGLPTTFLVKDGKIIKTLKGEFNFNSSKFINKLNNILKK